MGKIKRLLLIGVTTLTLVLGMSLQFAPAVSADASTDAAKKAACSGLGATSSGGNCNAGGPNLNSLVATVVNVLSVLVAIAAVIMIMVGGFKYITSGGDSSKTSGAKSTIMYAIIGLVIVAFAQFIVQFVVDTSTNPKTNKQSQN
jgi:hypothetical protein